jgi:hypothetical protein
MATPEFSTVVADLHPDYRVPEVSVVVHDTGTVDMFDAQRQWSGAA